MECCLPFCLLTFAIAPHDIQSVLEYVDDFLDSDRPQRPILKDPMNTFFIIYKVPNFVFKNSSLYKEFKLSKHIFVVPPS